MEKEELQQQQMAEMLAILRKLDRSRKISSAWSIAKVLLFVIPILLALPFIEKGYKIMVDAIGTVQSLKMIGSQRPQESSTFGAAPGIDLGRVWSCLKAK